MRLKVLCILAVLLCSASAALGAVRIRIKDGKRIIYNDGVGPSSREVLGKSDSWLAARIATPSLYDGLIADAARENSLDPKLVKSVVLIESAFNPAAVSRKGARGLMQLMPETAVRYGVHDLFDPTENLAGGARHLAYLLGLYGGDLPRALAAYNAGEAAVARYGGVPPFDETRIYVIKGMAAYYGKSSLGGGFGLAAGKTWGSVKSRPVRLTRDPKNRPLITTDFSPPRALKRG
ncbi:MAG TPA: lytic transglycosylase domain-containing protein [Thermoanaerobaculia bacterium]|nr:lytic transglycosylase domain-containing protein [Thermoanaerobaculia bacterium]